MNRLGLARNTPGNTVPYVMALPPFFLPFSIAQEAGRGKPEK